MKYHAPRLFLSILVLVAACDKHPSLLEPPTAAVTATSAARAAHLRGTSGIVERTWPLADQLVVTTTITPSGGVLRLERAGLLMLFPPGAVSDTVLVTVTAAGGTRVVYAFEPHGLRFQRPVWIAQQTSLVSEGPSLDAGALPVFGAYLGDDWRSAALDGAATFLETYAAWPLRFGGETYVVFATSHFSAYAFATARCEEESVEGCAGDTPP